MAITQADIAKWLGRPLTPNEVSNFATYLNIAESYLNELLCTDITDVTAGSRIYESRDGYSTVFTDYFTGSPTVIINGSARTDFKTRFFDDRNTAFKNSLVFDCKFRCDDEVTITATWGIDPLPDDLGSLLAQLFAIAAKPYRTDSDVKRKDVEDFSIWFGERSDVEIAVMNNTLIIQKYSLCESSNIRHGKVCRVWI